MSRIGKKPLLLPPGVDIQLEAAQAIVSGPHGSVRVPLAADVQIKQIAEPRSLQVTVSHPETVSERALWGLTRQLLQNAVSGVQKPFSRGLEFVGVGFKVALEGKNSLSMDVGFSHKVNFVLPEGIEAKVEKQIVTLHGVDKQAVGETAARIRRIKPPEPYKGKGIKYVDEVIRRKAGKAAKTGT